MYRILIVEDEPNMRLGLKDNLEFEGYEVDLAEEGNSGLEKILNNRYDLVLLDVMLPNLSGFDICKTVREQGVQTPIILLTAKGEEIDKVRGLEMGADDYVTKPFSLMELLARVKVVLRRKQTDMNVSDVKTLAAIMFTDIAGFTSVMNKSERKALELLEANQTLITSQVSRFNGTWIKEIGDGNLSSFRSATEAVNCAIAIQEEINQRDYELRIGIHIGDVVFKAGDVFGDGVNIASRIQSAVEGGGIYMSEPVYDNVKNQEGMSAESLGEKLLKNIDKPLKLYKLIH